MKLFEVFRNLASLLQQVVFISRKLPVGVHREDFARPLYRRDIFYSGSVLHVPEFSSHPNIRNYVKSVTTIPDEFETEEGSYICRCIPISKSAKDTLKQVIRFCLLCGIRR